MASKSKSVFLCGDCGATASKWSGQCPECGAWNSFTESTLPASRAETSSRSGLAPVATPLGQVKVPQLARMTTGSSEFDRVLGGGLVPGSVILLGGDPGIGKSTLLLQCLGALSADLNCLYVTGEESLAQTALRARRLEIAADTLPVLADNDLDTVFDVAARMRPAVIVADSIQTLYTRELQSAPGTVSQVREAGARLVRYAKQSDCVVLVVGHVTKEGHLAGPRILEHMVDTVLYFEGDPSSRYRLIRAVKNRFGAVNEIGVFAMTEKGLRGVSNPSAMFVAQSQRETPGSVILATQEGTRPLLVEVQALVDTSTAVAPRRLSVGLEHSRLAMLLAVLHRHGGLNLSDQDVFVNVVGGVRVSEPAADLAVLMAIASSFLDRSVAPHTVVFGEVGLTGEVRPVQRGAERLAEIAKLGFEQALLPAANKPGRNAGHLKLSVASAITDALKLLG